MLTLIGLAGRMGSGKDAAADVLCGEYGFVRMSFAEALRREICHQLLSEDFDAEYPLDIQALFIQYHRNLEAVYAKPTEPGMRRLLQWYGTEKRRAEDPDYWVKCANRALPDHGKYVFTDVRFQNEADFIGLRGGDVWMVRRPEQAQASEHVSELWCTSYTDYGQLLVNDGTLCDLACKIRKAMAVPMVG